MHIHLLAGSNIVRTISYFFSSTLDRTGLLGPGLVTRLSARSDGTFPLTGDIAEVDIVSIGATIQAMGPGLPEAIIARPGAATGGAASEEGR